MGIEKAYFLTRESVYRINMNIDIEQTVKQCSTCYEYQCSQPHGTTLHYEITYKPWEVVSADKFMVNSKTCVL